MLRAARKVNGKDFQETIDLLREQLLTQPQEQPSLPDSNLKVYVGKRPVLPHEPRNRVCTLIRYTNRNLKVQWQEFDVLTVVGENGIVVHDCQMYANMKQMYINSYLHTFSRCFDEHCDSREVYQVVTQPLLHHALNGGKSVCMMYGQTGSGKTFTNVAFQSFIADEIFSSSEPEMQHGVSLAVIEIIGSKCFDLLNRKKKTCGL